MFSTTHTVGMLSWQDLYNFQSWSKVYIFLLKVRTCFKKEKKMKRKIEEKGDKGDPLGKLLRIDTVISNFRIF